MMVKKIIILFTIIILFFFHSIPVSAERGFEYVADVPYNVLNGTWWTGINITPQCDGITGRWKINYFGGLSQKAYATRYIDVPFPSGATFAVQDLLSNPRLFISPTLLQISGPCPFVVAQFVARDLYGYSGFSHQIYESEYRP